MKENLLFVYNADSGFFNTLGDIGHKIFSPETYECNLCMMTHGYFSEYKDWRDFVKNLKLDSHFLHRDQFEKKFPSTNISLPAIFLQVGSEIELRGDSTLIEKCKSLDNLKSLIENSINNDPT